MTDKEKMVRETLDAWHQKVLDEILEAVSATVASLPLEETAPQMRFAAMNAIRNLKIVL